MHQHSLIFLYNDLKSSWTLPNIGNKCHKAIHDHFFHPLFKHWIWPCFRLIQIYHHFELLQRDFQKSSCAPIPVFMWKETALSRFQSFDRNWSFTKSGWQELHFRSGSNLDHKKFAITTFVVKLVNHCRITSTKSGTLYNLLRQLTHEIPQAMVFDILLNVNTAADSGPVTLLLDRSSDFDAISIIPHC